MKILHLLCFLLVFISCKKDNVKKQLTKITAKTIAVDSTISSSAEIDSFIAPYKEKLNSKMQQALSFTPKVLSKKDGNMQSTLGNLMADLCYEMATEKNNTPIPIDFSMFNYGGIRANIQKGNITNESAFKLMPFENELVAVTLTGEKITELVKYFISNKKAHPLSKNIELKINKSSYTLKINRKPFDKNKTYTVLTSDYLQSGGDKMIFFKNPEKLIKLDYKMRDAIIDFFKKTDTVKVTIDNRVILK